jgi:uroporphyrinogen III methyltransferase/synthase
MKKGFVYLVGAGPGRADLITVRGAEVLKTADCIIYDRLANPALLRFARSNAETIGVPKRDGTGLFTQPEINKLLLEKASNGKTIVRLKGGDPCIFGRCSEELAVLAGAGIDFEIVPGVTAAIAAADYTGIILTDREYSSQVVFVTGHEAEGKQKTENGRQTMIDWPLLAKFAGTIVFYMAVGKLTSVAEQLIENGMSSETLVAVITDATLPTQRVVKAPINRISATCKQEKIEPPAIVVIGAAADSDARLNWFMKKPLFGKSIVITRDEQGNAEFAAKIIARGGNPIEFTTMKIRPLTHSNKFLKALAKITKYDWIIFTSSNGVKIFFEALHSLSKDARVFASAKVAAIGPKTSEKLSEFGISADFVPSVFTSKELGLQLINYANLKNKNILTLRSELATDELIELLEHAGAKVNNVAIYTAVKNKCPTKSLEEKISKGQVGWLTFVSPFSARAFFEQIPHEIVNNSKIKIASIGPVTSEQLRDLGVKVNMEASEHTIDGLLNTIESTYK